MRWTTRQTKLKNLFYENKTRVIRKFLFIPKELDDEYRWFEFAYIAQEIDHVRVERFLDRDTFEYQWVDEHWVDGKLVSV